MAVQLGAQGQPDFNQPIELMMDCHRRIEHFLGVLGRVAERYQNTSLDSQGRVALETALNYFDLAAPRHTADEEESLFPRMRQSSDVSVQEVMAKIDDLEADHREAERAHERLDKLGRQWFIDREIGGEHYHEFVAILKALTNTYQAHIRVEDEQVFRAAGQLLNDAQLAEVGEEMRERRRMMPGREGSRCAQRRRESLQTDEAEHG